MALGSITVLEVTAGDGPLRMDLLQFAGDGAYPTGGTPNFQAAVRAALGKGRVEIVAVIGQLCGGRTVYYDKAADKLLVYSGTSEVANASDQSGVTFRLVAISK
jgi:hypothetical protein